LTKSLEEREQLIMDHLPQVRWIAGNIFEKIGGAVALDDLISTGIIGLINAIDNFDAARNASLRTYAEYKIRGAILDSVRGMDGVAPHKRKRIKQVQAAILAAERKFQREPEEQEIADELGIGIEEYQEWLLELRGITLGSLQNLSSEDGSYDLLQYLADDRAESPARIYERAELERALTLAIERMPAIEKTVINLYFMEELTLAEIGQVVGLHTSRVSQLKMQAILRLRSHLERRWSDGLVRAHGN
jgi:RNA polymerase sigma factor for flagellar operon FliA